MAIDFHFGSGSPFAWYVWLALEHKGVAYQAIRQRFDEGDLDQPAFRAINPRGRVPVLVDDGFVIYESQAIVAYLEDAYPTPALFPVDVRQKALTRRLVSESQSYLGVAVDELIDRTVYDAEPATPEQIAELVAAAKKECDFLGALLHGDWFVGNELSAADLAVYPWVRMLQRIDQRKPHYSVFDAVPESLRAFLRRVEGLPYYDKTFPPHWRS